MSDYAPVKVNPHPPHPRTCGALVTLVQHDGVILNVLLHSENKYIHSLTATNVTWYFVGGKPSFVVPGLQNSLCRSMASFLIKIGMFCCEC